MEGLMDQLEQLKTALSAISPELSLTAAVIFAVIGKAIFSLKRAIDFHNEYFVKKRIKRITELQILIKEGRPLTRFLDQTLETEAFRVGSGITASPAKMNALIEIHDSGLWTVSQLRSASRHLVIEANTRKASIKLTTADRVSAWASLGLSVFLLIMGSGYFVSLALTKTWVGFVVGTLIFGLFVMVAHLMAFDFRDCRMAQQVDAHLKISQAGEEAPRPDS